MPQHTAARLSTAHHVLTAWLNPHSTHRLQVLPLEQQGAAQCLTQLVGTIQGGLDLMMREQAGREKAAVSNML